MCNSIPEMNAAFQFALVRSSGNSEPIQNSSLLAKYLLSTSKALSARQTNYQFLFDLEKAENLQIACEIAQTEAAPDLYINMWAWGFNGFNKPFEHVALRQC